MSEVQKKARRNLVKHRIAFEVVAQVFDDPKATSEMDRIVDGEQRWLTIGRVGTATIFFVSHSWIDDDGEIRVRIISARKAHKREVGACDKSDQGHFR